jgi:hypothetical protein
LSDREIKCSKPDTAPLHAVGWFVMAKRAAEVHVKVPNARPISDEAAALAGSTLSSDSVGWRMFQWLQRSLVPDRSVVD